MLCIESGGRSYAFDVTEFTAAAGSCPFVAYGGLPAGVSGVVQWGGRVFPVIDLARALGIASEGIAPGADTMFLFSIDRVDGLFHEFAVPVPCDARLIAPVEVAPAPEGAPACVRGLVRDTEGLEAQLVDIHRLARAA